MSTHPLAVGPQAVLVRYGELALKRGNREYFEDALERNIRAACAPIAPIEIERVRGRILVLAESRVDTLARRLSEVFGIVSVSPAWRVAPEVEAIASAARGVLEDALALVPAGETVSFRVRATRADKSFPLDSGALERFVAERIVRTGDPLRIQLEKPELTLGIDVRAGCAWIFARRYAGPGGLPVGTLGRVLCLLSGGIDSPVAAWMAMKRGCAASFVTFHSHPFIGDGAKQKVVDLVRVLARHQGRSRLFVVPFADVQLAIKEVGRDAYRTVMYRRFMQRIASRIADDERAKALITGECLGQVASQTLENMCCIDAAATLPVLRPLIGFDKEEIVVAARRIGTFDISCVQEPDCCTLFTPQKPVIRGRIRDCEALEDALDVEALVQRACSTAELIEVDP